MPTCKICDTDFKCQDAKTVCTFLYKGQCDGEMEPCICPKHLRREYYRKNWRDIE